MLGLAIHIHCLFKAATVLVLITGNAGRGGEAVPLAPPFVIPIHQVAQVPYWYYSVYYSRKLIAIGAKRLPKQVVMGLVDDSEY